MISISARAVSSGTLGQGTSQPCVAIFPVLDLGVWTRGTHISTFCGKEKPWGITPMMVVGAPFIRTVRPMIAGSFPYRRSQKP